jgi:hypothetical protein
MIRLSRWPVMAEAEGAYPGAEGPKMLKKLRG